MLFKDNDKERKAKRVIATKCLLPGPGSIKEVASYSKLMEYVVRINEVVDSHINGILFKRVDPWSTPKPSVKGYDDNIRMILGDYIDNYFKNMDKWSEDREFIVGSVFFLCLSVSISDIHAFCSSPVE